jgi:hypothetical protein
MNHRDLFKDPVWKNSFSSWIIAIVVVFCFFAIAYANSSQEAGMSRCKPAGADCSEQGVVLGFCT